MIRADPRMTSLAAAAQSPDGVSVYRYDGTVATSLALTDDEALPGILGGLDAIRGLVDSTDPAVRRWATDRWEASRDVSVEAAPIGPSGGTNPPRDAD
jgi:hypothetical protein